MFTRKNQINGNRNNVFVYELRSNLTGGQQEKLNPTARAFYALKQNFYPDTSERAILNGSPSKTAQSCFPEGTNILEMSNSQLTVTRLQTSYFVKLKTYTTTI